MESITKDFYTAEEIADILQVAPITIRRMAKRGEIPFYQIGKQQRFSKKDLTEFLESKKVDARKEKTK